VFEDPFVRGAAVSARIDVALALTARVHGDKLAKTLELAIDYDQPPFDAGAPEKVDASTLARSRPDAGQAPRPVHTLDARMRCGRCREHPTSPRSRLRLGQGSGQLVRAPPDASGRLDRGRAARLASA
jgi:hypothetical protein